MSDTTPKKGEKGKGGNFETKRNPFGKKKEHIGGAPELAASIGLGAALDACLHAGHAVMLGHTRDGGALVITILDEEQRHRTYCSNDEELDDAIRAMQELYAE